MLQNTSKACCLCRSQSVQQTSVATQRDCGNPTQSSTLEKLLGNTCPSPVKLSLWFCSSSGCPDVSTAPLINQRDPNQTSSSPAGSLFLADLVLSIILTALLPPSLTEQKSGCYFSLFIVAYSPRPTFKSRNIYFSLFCHEMPES